MSNINFYNGRVVNVDKTSYSSMDMTEDDYKKSNKNYNCNAVNNIQQSTNLSNLYFSEQNINNIQNQIRFNVYKATGQTIGRQSDTELKIIMRSYYLQYGKNDPNNLKAQVLELNSFVLNYCTPKIIDELKQHLGYIQDIQNLPMPLERPMNMSSAGTKYLKSVTSTF